jgi:hypothetical protein
MKKRIVFKWRMVRRNKNIKNENWRRENIWHKTNFLKNYTNICKKVKENCGNEVKIQVKVEIMHLSLYRLDIIM